MPNTVKSRLSDLLKSSGMTPIELARASKIDYTTVYRIANGDTQNPSRKTLQPIADALNVSVDYLQKGIGEKTAPVTEASLLERALAKLEQQLDKKDKVIESLTAILLGQKGSDSFRRGLNVAGLLKNKSLRPEPASA